MIDPAVVAATQAIEADILAFSRREHDHMPTNERVAQVAVEAARPVIVTAIADAMEQTLVPLYEQVEELKQELAEKSAEVNDKSDVGHAVANAWMTQAERATALLRYAYHLRVNGENAPGGNETWAQFDADAEWFLRGLDG